MKKEITAEEIGQIESVLSDEDFDQTFDIATDIISFWEPRPCIDKQTGQAFVPDSHYGELKNAICWALRKERAYPRLNPKQP